MKVLYGKVDRQHGNQCCSRLAPHDRRIQSRRNVDKVMLTMQKASKRISSQLIQLRGQVQTKQPSQARIVPTIAMCCRDASTTRPLSVLAPSWHCTLQCRPHCLRGRSTSTSG